MLRSSRRLAPLGAWIEQLIAESTGKDGRGILPVDGEMELDAHRYPGRPGVRRPSPEQRADGWPRCAGRGPGTPAAECVLDSPDELGAVMYRWEIATAVAGAVMGINPFDQPNVESAKIRARSMVDAYRDTGSLPVLTPDGGPRRPHRVRR